MLNIYNLKNKSILLRKCKIFYKNYSTRVTNDRFAPKYVPSAVEFEKYTQWEKNNRTTFEKNIHNKFSIILPPPNITGTLHLGHALTLTIQDVLYRWHKMCGKSCVWIPGTDHAGIATQVVVEKKLWNEQNKTRHDIGRSEFKKEILKWKEDKANVIKQQIKSLGALPDWSKEFFTMDNQQSEAVIEAFIRLFESGLIYRTNHLVNWSCHLQSTISDIEVEYLEIEGPTKISVPGYNEPVTFGSLFKFAYKLQDIEGELDVCTTRPETIIGDVALAVHPNDNRYTKFHGMHVFHPFRKENIPIICDEIVDPNFGTGILKITPAHDPIDFDVAKRHNLKILPILNEDGTMNHHCNIFSEMKRFDARMATIDKLKELNLFRGSENHKMSIPICTRSKDVIEYLVKPQWFVKTKDMAEKAILDVKNGKLKIQPTNFEKNWFQWLENIRDWCISRQLWWGHQIPVYLCKVNNKNEKSIWVAAKSESNALEKACILLNESSENICLKQDEDVLDTWFSSALLPFSVFGWPKQDVKNEYYPLSLMETGHDILFFWVARMIMLGTELTGELPFTNILLHGIICDSQGRKMSKSLGNVIDPQDIIKGISLKELTLQTEKAVAAGLLTPTERKKAIVDQTKLFPNGIPECGADALRYTLCSHNLKNHFINFDVQECYTNKLFCNKIWQACKFTKLNLDKLSLVQDLSMAYTPSVMDRWILSRLSNMVTEVNNALSKADFFIATAAIKQFLYYELCDIYLETSKIVFKDVNNMMAGCNIAVLILCLQKSICCLSPFMPFLTDELYVHLPNHSVIEKKGSIIDINYPQVYDMRNEVIENQVQIILDTITIIRRLKKLFGIPTKEKSSVNIVTSKSLFNNFEEIIKNLTNSEKVVISTVISSNFTNSKICDTINNYGTVYLSQPEINTVNKNIIKEKKINKIIDKIDKMQTTMNEEGYKIKAPQHVQISHMKQLQSLKEELEQLQQLTNN